MTPPLDNETSLLTEPLVPTRAVPLDDSPLLEELLLCTSSSDHIPTEPMSWYNPASYVMDVINLTHDITGLSYASSIVVVTIACRMALFKLGVWSRRNQGLRDVVQPQINVLYEKFFKTDDVRTKKRLVAQIRAIEKQSGYNPRYRFISPVATIASLLTMFYGFRMMGYYYPTELSTGGVLWFIDLTKPDPIMFLPFVSAVTFVAGGELSLDAYGRPKKETGWKQVWFWRFVRTVLIPVLFSVPASVHCFWIPSTMFGVGQSFILSKPLVVRKLGLQETPPEAVRSSMTGIDYLYSKINKDQDPLERFNNMKSIEKGEDEIVYYKDEKEIDGGKESKHTSTKTTFQMKSKSGKKKSKRKK